MGAGASSLPDSLSDEQIRALTAESFQENLHKTLQDADGAVPKVLFVNCFEQGVEREVFQLFMAYAPDGMMPKSTFLSLCRVNKLLHKNTCTSKMAGEIFESALRLLKRAEGESPRLAETIGYNQFRTLVVPEFAKLKKMEVDALLERLSRCEFPSSVVLAGSELSRSQKDQANIPDLVTTAVVPPTADNTDSTVTPEAEPEAALKEKNRPLSISTDVLGALTKLQTLSRRKIAQRKVEQLKEVRDIETGKAPRSRRPTIEPEPTKRRASRESDRIKSLMAEQAAMKKEIKELLGQVSEGAEETGSASLEESEPPKELTPAEIAEHSLNDLFDIYCSPPGEMDVNAFKKFLRETYTLTKKFTINDADTVFKKAVAKASTAPQTSHMRKGVFYGKRLNFYVFFHSVIPLTAKQRGGISTQQLIEFLNNANVAARARDIKKRQDTSRRSSKDLSAAKRERRPSRDLPPAHLSSKDGDPNPFSRRRPSGEKLGEGMGIASGPRKSFDKGVVRKSFDKGPSKSASEAGLPKAS